MVYHTKTYTIRKHTLVSALTAKNRTFKVVRNAIWSAGIISSEKYSAVWRTSAIRSKKILSVRTAKVFNSELKTIQPFEQQWFSVQQKRNQIQLSWRFRFAQLSHSCHGAPLSLLAYISKVLLNRYKDTKRCYSIQDIFFPVYYYYSPPQPWLRPSRNACCVTIYSNGCNVD